MVYATRRMFATYFLFMTYAKSQVFNQDLQEVASIAKAVSHPARWAILLYLAQEKRCISGDISKELPLSRSTVSQHLQELKESGLIQGEVEGKNVSYCLNPKKLTEVIALLQQISQPLTNYIDENNNCNGNDGTNCCS